MGGWFSVPGLFHLTSLSSSHVPANVRVSFFKWLRGAPRYTRAHVFFIHSPGLRPCLGTCRKAGHQVSLALLTSRPLGGHPAAGYHMVDAS